MSAARTFDSPAFREAYDRLIVRGRYTEESAYYPRYRSRYEALTRLYAQVAGPPPIDVLDIGGGQYATLAAALWGDRAVLADVTTDNAGPLASLGVRSVQWNLCGPAQPFEASFDVVVFSEVIEHLPVPGHLVLERLRRALRPGGVLICTTPNLYRLRNIVYLALGKRIFDHFRIPDERGLGHVLEYSREHLQWQLERAGFGVERLELRHFPHLPQAPLFRVLAIAGSPLYLVPRFRDHLVAVGRSPAAGAAA